MTALATTKPNHYGRLSFPTLFDSFFDKEFMKDFYDDVKTSIPANVKETNDNYEIHLATPGFNKENFKIELDRDLLTISAEHSQKKEDTNEKWNMREYNFSSFKRSFSLPKFVNVDEINATYSNGVLSVILPKAEESKTKKFIEIKID